MLRGKCIYKSALSLQNGRGTGKAKFCKLSSPYTAEVRICGVKNLAHGSACQEFPQARSLGSSGAKAVYHLFFRETKQLRGGGTGGKGTDYRGSMPVFIGGRVDGLSDAGTCLIACSHCFDYLSAAQVKLLRKGKSGRNGDDSQMGDGCVVHIVHIHDMAKYCI